MSALVDTNVLVYRCDPRFPAKQRVADELLRWGIESGGICLPHQALIEFVAATTRPTRGPEGTGPPLLSKVEAQREVEDLLLQHVVLFPNEDVIATALRLASSYQLSWYDAHLLAYAEVFGLPQLYSEDFEHDRFYGQIRVTNPFRQPDVIHEPRAGYG